MLTWMVSAMILAGSGQVVTESKPSWLPEGHRVLNIVAPPAAENKNPELPVVVEPFFEHVRGAVEEIGRAHV